MQCANQPHWRAVSMLSESASAAASMDLPPALKEKSFRTTYIRLGSAFAASPKPEIFVMQPGTTAAVAGRPIRSPPNDKKPAPSGMRLGQNGGTTYQPMSRRPAMRETASAPTTQAAARE